MFEAALSTRSRYCYGDSLVRIVQTNYFEANALDLYNSPLTLQHVSRLSTDATYVLQLAQMSAKSTKKRKEGGIQADFFRRYDGVDTETVKVYFRSSR